MMDKNLWRRLMWIGITGMFLAGAIFIGIFLFSENKNNILLYAALSCELLAGLFNTIRVLYDK